MLWCYEYVEQPWVAKVRRVVAGRGGIIAALALGSNWLGRSGEFTTQQ